MGTTVRFRLIGLCVGLSIVFAFSCILFLLYIAEQRGEHRAQEEQERRLTAIAEVGGALLSARQATTAATNARLNSNEQGWKDGVVRTNAAYAHFYDVLERLGAFDPQGRITVEQAVRGAWPGLNERAFQEFVGRAAEKPALNELQRRFALVEKTLNEGADRERGRAREIQQASEARAQVGQRAAIGLSVLTFLAMGLVILTVLRSVLRPMRVVVEAIRQVNAGETLLDLPQVDEGEFGEVATAVRHFRARAEKLQRQAYRDPLTGLGNRTYLGEVLEHSLVQAAATANHVVLLYLDVDRFRVINDRVGALFSDRYLCEIATRLSRFIPQDAELFRHGGDKFVVMLAKVEPGPMLRTQLQSDAEALLRCVQEPFAVGSEMVSTTASVGISLSPEDGSSAEQLIRSAEAAVHAAKRAGRAKVRFASGQQTAVVRSRAVLASEMARGIKRGEFELYYQPIVDFAARKVVAAEALLRWNHPLRGLLLAGAFIDVAEEEGLIVRLGEECLRLAHVQAKDWTSRGIAIRQAVNVSARQLQEGLLEKLHALRAEFGEDDACPIDLELTESALFDHSDQTRNTLLAMKKMGYRLGLDDFGTGYSSLSYLLRLPIDKIKIDRAFVAEIERRQETMAVIGATITLARILKLDVVAEGVENPVQAELLFQQGCALLQGFHFSPALPVRAFEAWVEQYDRQIQIAG